METCTITGSPNWYLSQILDCSWDNRVAYGSLSSLVIFDPSQILNPVTLNLAHSSRVLSVAFPPQGFGNRLLSTSESGEIFVWDLDSRKVAFVLKNPQRCPTYGSWSHADGNLIVCVDENGNLLQWKIDSNVVNIKAFKEHTFVVVACCPHNKELVATGTKQGLVCVLNIKVSGKEYIVHKLRGHDSELVSLAWCPVRENVISSKNKDDCLLLASGAREKKIFFWRAGQDGLYEAYIDMPLAPRPQGAKQWTCVSWHEPQHLLASTVVGEVYSIHISKIKTKKNADKGQKWERFSDHHSRGHVVVKSSPWKIKEAQCDTDWRAKETSPGWVWTCGSDRVLFGRSSEKRNAIVKLNTIGGPVNAMAISQIDGTSLAMGVADKSIRVINLSEPSFKTMQTFDQKVSAKVMSLSWHPSKDGWLAYGTSDGRIGIQFTCAVKLPILFRPFTKESIYAMEWGPSLASIKTCKELPENSEEVEQEIKSSRYVLYAIGGGRIAALDPNKTDEFYEEPFKDVLKGLLKSENSKSKNRGLGLTDMAWKPGYGMLALGDETGSIHLLNLTAKEEFQLVCSFKVHTSLIQDLAWHPSSCTNDQTVESPYMNWLAAASNDVNIRIVDTSTVYSALQNLSDDISLPISNVPCIATLKGHKFRVSKVAWSPHEGGRLLSVSYDQCAQVWDVIKRQPIACFTQHSAPLYSCLWSPFNPDIAMSAGQDGTVCFWGVLDQEYKTPIAKNKDGKHLLEGAREALIRTGGNENTVTGGGNNVQKQNKRREKALLPLSGPEVLKDDSNLAILRFLLHPPEDRSLIFSCLNEENSKTLPLHYAFFGDQPVVEHYLMKESKHVAKENSFTLDVWRGSIKEAISEAIQTKCLTDYMVSVAPSVSHKIWLEACATYAEQLKDIHEFSKASAYLLAIHRVAEAINLLADQGKYRHALAVARCRLSEDDPQIKNLLTAWAEDNISQGRHCLAAVCYGSAGNWEKAAQWLAHKKCPDRLLLASQIMREKCPDHQAGTFYARECFEVSLSQKSWHTAQLILDLYSNLNHLALRAFVHEMLCTSTDNSTPDDWLLIDKDKNKHEPLNELVQEPLHLCGEEVVALQKDLVNEVTVNSDESAWLAASSKVTSAYLTAPELFPRIMKKFVVEGITPKEQNLGDAYRSLVQAMSLLYHFHITKTQNDNGVPILLKFCMWLAPEGVFGPNSVFASPVSPLQGSLRAYLASGLLLWLGKMESDNQHIRLVALKLIESLKSDIFSLDSLKWFKVEFKLKVLQDSKMNKAQKEKKEENQSKDSDLDKEEERLKSLSIQEDAPTSNSVLSQNGTSQDSDIKDHEIAVDTEIDQLSAWLQEFAYRREKVPNPYLSYSGVIQCIKSITEPDDCSEILQQFSKFWEETNMLLDI